jgi:hypothetical protein
MRWFEGMYIGKLMKLSKSSCSQHADEASPSKTSPVQNTPAALLNPGKNSGLTFKTVSIRRPSTGRLSTSAVIQKYCPTY